MNSQELSAKAQEFENSELNITNPVEDIKQSAEAQKAADTSGAGTDSESDTSTSSNPIEGIKEEVEKAKHAPKRCGALTIKKANDWVNDALNRPDPQMFFHNLIVQYENTVLFAQSNVGKTILAVQIATAIAAYYKVLYIDLELSDKQFQMRYTDTDAGVQFIFPDNFIRAEIDPEQLTGADLEQEILDSIEEAAKQGVKFIFLDNLTFACSQAEKAADASQFMLKIIRLKKKYGLTTVVVSHTPKIHGYQPITQYDLSGSAKLISFFDAGIAVARSAKDNNLRYVKQVKVRTGEFVYDADNVMIFDVEKTNGCLQYVLQGYAHESEHLKEGGGSKESAEIEAILKLKAGGKSTREIAKILDMSKSTVHNRLDKARRNGITLDDATKSTVQPVQPVHDVGQSGQSGQLAEMGLFKEEE